MFFFAGMKSKGLEVGKSGKNPHLVWQSYYLSHAISCVLVKVPVLWVQNKNSMDLFVFGRFAWGFCNCSQDTEDHSVNIAFITHPHLHHSQYLHLVHDVNNRFTFLLHALDKLLRLVLPSIIKTIFIYTRVTKARTWLTFPCKKNESYRDIKAGRWFLNIF